MKLDAPIDITIGPYETYNDEIFGYKAAFEAYVTLRDDEETAKLKMFADHHAGDREQSSAGSEVSSNPKIGALAPIRVVNRGARHRATARMGSARRLSICPTTSAS